MERETGIEPATNSLEGCDSTTELLPRPITETRKSKFGARNTVGEFRVSILELQTWWTGEDSNPRSSQGAAGLQPAAINHSATCPDLILLLTRHKREAVRPSAGTPRHYGLSRRIRVCGQAEGQTYAPRFVSAK